MVRRIVSSFIRYVTVFLWITLTIAVVSPPKTIWSAPGAASDLILGPGGQIKPPRQSSVGLPPDENNSSPSLTPKQKQELLKSNFEKMKQQADELAELAKSLQEDLDKSNVNVLSLKVVDKAEKIEKLAKRIKDSAKGH